MWVRSDQGCPKQAPSPCQAFREQKPPMCHRAQTSINSVPWLRTPCVIGDKWWLPFCHQPCVVGDKQWLPFCHQPCWIAGCTGRVFQAQRSRLEPGRLSCVWEVCNEEAGGESAGETGLSSWPQVAGGRCYQEELTCISCPHTACSQEASPEVWSDVQLSTIELSITTRNSQLDLTVSALLCQTRAGVCGS